MAIGGILSIAFLAVLVLRGVRGHGRGDKTGAEPDDRLEEER